MYRYTPKQKTLTSLLAEGIANKEIAARMGITEGSLKVSLSRLYSALGIAKAGCPRVLAVLIGIAYGVVPCPGSQSPEEK